LLDKTVGSQLNRLPESVSADPVTLVRADAVLKVVAGGLFAFGKVPRLSAAVLASSMVPTTFVGHPFWEAKDPAERQRHLIHFLKNAGLVGGLLIAAGDTAGKPSLGWRARRAAKQAAKRVSNLPEQYS
jgi:uncharacterized membrane protein YphA (DoxX/SURF4 family)